MYRPPENSNRVKAITSKFENNANGTPTAARPPLRKSKTLQDFSVTPIHERQEKLHLNSNRNNNKLDNKNTQQTLSRQLSDPTKRNIKRTPAFRLDRTSDSNTGFMQNKARYLEKIGKNNYTVDDKEGANNDNNNFSNIRNKFNANTSVPEISRNGKNIKFLYSEPIPKSLRIKPSTIDEKISDIYTASTLKISESHSQNTKKECSLKKDVENVSLTDTLKNALKKPLPIGPAPKKPPRTFLHSANNDNNNSQSNVTLDFTKKLNLELQKNIPNANKKTKSDPKYMLDKLENALKNKGVLRKNHKTELSEDDSDNEKSKFNFRDLPTIPVSQNTINSYSSPENSPKFNLNCLPSLSCSNSNYTAIKEPNSSFFVTCKEEEPVYAEPFEYQLEVEQKNCHGNNGAIENVARETSNVKATIRRSVHYASSPVPDVKIDEGNNHVSEVKIQDQVQSNFISTSHVCSSLN